MTASYTPGASDMDDVRLLISDIGGNGGSEFIFQDEEIQRFLALRPNIEMAAAVALRVLASNEALVSKRIKFLELETDGPAVAKELRAMAESYEKSDIDNDEPEVIEMGVDDFSRRYLMGWNRV